MDALKGALVWAGVGVAPAPVWGTLLWRAAWQEATRTRSFSRPSNELLKRRNSRTLLERTNMPEKHIALAVSLAKILVSTREHFAGAIRDAAIARIKACPARSIYAGQGGIPRCALEQHVDDALYAIGRDRLDGLEANVRSAVDEIVREALDAARKGAPHE